MSRVDQLNQNDLPNVLHELVDVQDNIQRQQRIGGGNLLGYVNKVSDAQFDYIRTNDGSIGVSTDRIIYVVFVADNQPEPVARLHAVVDISGSGVWSPENSAAFNFDVRIIELPDFVTVWQVIFSFDDVRSYFAKFYVVATDTGTVSIEE